MWSWLGSGEDSHEVLPTRHSWVQRVRIHQLNADSDWSASLHCRITTSLQITMLCLLFSGFLGKCLVSMTKNWNKWNGKVEQKISVQAQVTSQQQPIMYTWSPWPQIQGYWGAMGYLWCTTDCYKHWWSRSWTQMAIYIQIKKIEVLQLLLVLSARFLKTKSFACTASKCGFLVEVISILC